MILFLNSLVLVLGILGGFFVASLARDELVSGKKWFMALIGISVVGIVMFFENYLAWMFGFILVFSFAGLLVSKSNRKALGK